ncbi:DUF4179 domain-containing protein [Clostridium hydrogenum]|uniref:DUF4179 domain-containing protein n=1 Tax=Clostridium hydrogenum TaxID=2855764 RepID=UPI001F3875FE|nr:DUF4179 domain-containing protein [Clostridium hydrogenum]
MGEKDIFRAFNNVNIDEHEFDNVEINMNDIQKKKLKNNLKDKIKTNKFKKLKIFAASAAAALICITGIGYMNPSFASQIPGLNPIVQTLNYYGDQGEYEKYSEVVDKTVTFNGNSFTINSVVCDENSIIIGYTIKSDKTIDTEKLPGFMPSFKINGIPINSGGGGADNVTNANTYIGTFSIDMAGKSYFPNKFKFDMSFDSLLGVKGNWDFKFIVSREALNKETHSFTPNLNVKLKNASIKIKKVSLTPINTTIIFDSNKDLGPSSWIILDDKGNEILEKCGESSKSPFTNYEYTKYLTKANGIPKYLTVVSYPAGGNSGNTSKDTLIPLNSKLPFKASQGNNGSITITGITNSADKITIQGIAEGTFPQMQITHTYLIGLNPEAKFQPHIEKISANKYKFTLEYSNLTKNKIYQIRVENLDFINYNSKFTIPLK